jgi:hypothetical protein
MSDFESIESRGPAVFESSKDLLLNVTETEASSQSSLQQKKANFFRKKLMDQTVLLDENDAPVERQQTILTVNTVDSSKGVYNVQDAALSAVSYDGMMSMFESSSMSCPIDIKSPHRPDLGCLIDESPYPIHCMPPVRQNSERFPRNRRVEPFGTRVNIPFVAICTPLTPLTPMTPFAPLGEAH